MEERGFNISNYNNLSIGELGVLVESEQLDMLLENDETITNSTNGQVDINGNLMVGSVVNAGKDRMLNAGRMEIPQIVAPGCLDLIDFAGWQTIPENAPVLKK